MREVDFLPAWYARRRRRSARRGAQIRLAAAALGCGLSMSAAVLAMGGGGAMVGDAALVATPSPAESQADPRLPVATARALELLNESIPPGLAITSLAAHSGRKETGRTIVEIEVRGTGDARVVQAFVTSLRRRATSRLVDRRVGEQFMLSLELEAPAGPR